MNHLELDFGQIEEALSFIDPNLPYTDWAKVGRALYSEHGDSVRDIFEAWSEQGASYNKKAFNSWWKNFHKTRKTSFGSFIYEATQAGWKPQREKLTEEERAQRAKEYAKQKQAAQAKREAAEKDQWQELKEEETLFLSWPVQFAPTKYQLKKQMADACRYVDVRLGKDKYNQPCLVWPIYEELFNQGRFCGFERILDKGFKVGDKTINKLSSDFARTDIGFCTFGKFCDRGTEPKRVFVVGGFADAYSAHVSSGEVIITPIGEGNIPRLIELLSKKHPDIQFIAAPDNDKAGWEMIERSGGFWTLPQLNGKDWSDVFITEGSPALVDQLNHIRGYEVVESNSRYLGIQIRKGLNLICSDMGTGKSTSVQQFVKKNPHLKTLIVSHRRALAKSLKNSINDDTVQVEYYEDLIIKDSGPGVDANMALRAANILVCSVDSLHRLATSRWDMVFIDEVEQNLGHYFAETNRFGEACLSYITFALRNSQYQILADAHLGELTKAFCNRIGLHAGTLYQNNYQVGKGRTLYVYESKTHLTEELMQQLMSGGKRYIYANSKAEVKRIATALEQERERKNYHGTVLVVHADVTANQDVADALQDINAVVPELDVIIASPTLGTGFDISSNCHQFDKTIGFLSSRVGTSEEGHQGLNRARDIKEFHVYLDPAERSEPTDPTYIQSKLIEEVSIETMKVLSIDSETGKYVSKNPLYEWLYCEVKAQQNVSKNRYKDRFIEIAKKSGYEVVHVFKNEFAAKMGNVIRELANERTKRELLREIDSAPVHTGESFNSMMANGENFTAVEISKSKVVHDLNLDDATEDELDSLYMLAKGLYNEFKQPGENVKYNEADNEIKFPSSIRDAVATALTFHQEQNRYVSAIKKLSWVNVTESTAKALDTKDVQHAESRVSWRHLSIRRSHLIKLLQSAGINEALEYNGKEWSAEELSNVLRSWLKKKATKDRLFKYSNITVTENTLENPVKWFNNHLRSFGVPIVSNKKRTKQGVINVYSVDKDAWEGVCSLVSMRSRGIEEGIHNAEIMDLDVIERTVMELINDINDGKFKPGWNVLFEKLDKRCQLAGLADLREELAQTFAGIAHRFEDQIIVKNDPLRPIDLYKTIGSSGSPSTTHEPSRDGGFAVLEEGENGSCIRFPIQAAQNLSAQQITVAEEVARIAIEEHKQAPYKVIDFMIEEGLENFTSHPEAFARSIVEVFESERPKEKYCGQHSMEQAFYIGAALRQVGLDLNEDHPRKLYRADTEARFNELKQISMAYERGWHEMHSEIVGVCEEENYLE